MTTDAGITWSVPRVILNTAERQQTIGNIIRVDPLSGTLYDFTDLIQTPNPDGISANSTQGFNVAFIKSTDGGAPRSAPQIIASMVNPTVTDPNTGALIRTGDIIPESAVDPSSGHLYVVWQDSRFMSNPSLKKGVVQIASSTSADGGRTWSAPRSISTPSGQPAFTPTISVNSSGVVGVTYYDFRNLQAGNTTTLPTDY
jgi:Neuraminidase (sialidase)